MHDLHISRNGHLLETIIVALIIAVNNWYIKHSIGAFKLFDCSICAKHVCFRLLYAKL